jgi:hypothetical protein
VAEVGGQPEPPRRDPADKIDFSQDHDHGQDNPAAGVRRCSVCRDRLIFDPRRPNRTVHTHCQPRAQRAIQPPLLLGVPTPPPGADAATQPQADTA